MIGRMSLVKVTGAVETCAKAPGGVTTEPTKTTVSPTTIDATVLRIAPPSRPMLDTDVVQSLAGFHDPRTGYETGSH